MKENKGMVNRIEPIKHYLVASDFDQTLSFNDSGFVLSEMLGINGFHEKVTGLSKVNLVQQGAELTYLLRHDPEFRGVRREHLVEAGKRVRLKKHVELFARMLDEGIAEARFSFFVISASPREVVESALEGIVPAENIIGTDFDYDPKTGEICAVKRVAAGYGKVAVLQELETKLQITPDHTIYIGDGSSDMTVMQHVNSIDGHTIAVSEVKNVGRIAQRTVLSDNAPSVLVPVLEDVFGWDSAQIRELFATYGLVLQSWDKIRTDWVSFHETSTAPDEAPMAFSLHD
ncbi:MAG: HAD-IB family phosphatase [Verrucomicrobia bacterium]|nr:HAD-IB family phosphatase [Verrucomicrobiota bacterium]